MSLSPSAQVDANQRYMTLSPSAQVDAYQRYSLGPSTQVVCPLILVHS